MNVLLVADDERVAAQVQAALIGTEGLVVERVGTPARALSQIDEGGEGAYDIVLADADTAPEGGFSLARGIKDRHKMGVDTPPVVLLLARAVDRFLSDWSQADAYLLKPVDPFDLAEVLASLVAGEGVPALPRVGGDPVPSILDRDPDPEALAAASIERTGGAAVDVRDEAPLAGSDGDD